MPGSELDSSDCGHVLGHALVRVLCLNLWNCLRMRFLVRNAKAARLTEIIPIRSVPAVGMDRPIPVPQATYAARQAGHFGINRKLVPVKIQDVKIPSCSVIVVEFFVRSRPGPTIVSRC